MDMLLNRATLGEQVTELLRALILENKLAAGERLVESELAERLNVSRTPIREALITLEAAGLVRRLDNGHLVAVERSLEDMISAFHFRIALESYAAGLAAQVASEAQLDELEEKCAEFEIISSGQPYDREQLMTVGEEFHHVLVEMAGNPHISRHVSEIRDYTSSYRERLFRLPTALETNAVSHRDILNALRARDSQEARQLMDDHLSYALDLLKQLWKPQAR
jgi:DNA-binding GntR family transcriptional regulator